MFKRTTEWDEEIGSYLPIQNEEFLSLKYYHFWDFINYIGQLEDRIEELENAAN